MPSPAEQIASLQAAIAAQDALRPVLGDAVVDTTIAALRAQLSQTRAQQETVASAPAAFSPEQLLARLLPKELADKMRATGHIEGERKQATVMFADLSGFTALGERLDPEEVSAFQNDLFPEMAAAVYEYEGYIDKFIGDAIMAVFGAPIAHEDDPERALRAALDMRARIAQLNRAWAERLGHALSLHVGINTGIVIAGEINSLMAMTYTVTGDTVNVASRLSDAAVPGQILVSRETYRLTQGAFDFIALDPITVKGKREPLAVFEVQRAKLRPLKTRGIKELGSAFVGRDAERAQLREVLDDLLAGHGCIVTVVGESGLGKSRLMAEWHAEMGERARWREGRAFAHTAGVAYGPFLDFFRRYADIKDDEPESKARAILDRAVTRFFGADREAHALLANLLAMRLSDDEAALIAALPAQAIRHKIFDLIAYFVEQATRRRPMVLVLEDVHWADSTSVDVVAHLLPLTKRIPLAIVIISRPDRDVPASRLLSEIASHYSERAAQIALAPLSEDSSIEMVEQLLSSHELPATLLDMIRGKAEGNPFFVEEVIRMLIERGALVRAVTPDDEAANGAWVATPLINSLTVPNTLQGVLMSRLDRLPAETKWLAQQASVIGRIFLYRVLLRIADAGAELDTDLSYLERQELIRERARHPEIEYVFKHALTQDVAYQSLLAGRRKELHGKVGEAMETLFGERLGEFSGIIAFHFLRGEAWERAAHYLLQAGDAAMGLYAHTEARQHFSGALAALSHLPDTADQRRRRVDTITKLVSVSWVADDPKRNLERLNEAEALLRTLPADDQSGAADNVSGRLRLARLHYWMGRAHYLLNAPREAIGYYRQVLAVAEELHDEQLLAIPSSVIGQAMMVQGLFAKAEPLLAQAIAPLEKAVNWIEWVRAVGFLGVSFAAQGRYAEGLVEAQRALTRARELNNDTVIALSHLYLTSVYLMGDALIEMADASRMLVEVATKSGDRLLVYLGHGFQGWAAGRLGRYAQAVAHMTQSQAVGQSLGGRLLLADWFAAANAEIAIGDRRVAETLSLAENAVTFARAGGGVFSEGIAQRAWARALAAGESGSLDHAPRWDDADTHMQASLNAFELGAAQLEAARTHIIWAALYRARQDVSAARAHIEQAIATFERSGLPEPLQQARALLAELS